MNTRMRELAEQANIEMLGRLFVTNVVESAKGN